jgi:hypothetical protein
LEYRDDIIPDAPLPPEVAQAGFEHAYEEIETRAGATSSSDNSADSLPDESSAENPDRIEHTEEPQHIGSRFFAGLWGLLRNAAGVVNRTDENPPNSSDS